MTARGAAAGPPAGAPPSDFRLAKVLAVRRDIEGGYAALARAISDCWRDDPRRKRDGSPRARRAQKDVVDRRKLTRLILGRPGLVLSLVELRALDCYLERFGEGLAFRPLFEKPDVVQTLAHSGHVTFMLASKPGEEGGTFAHWDVLAMAEMQRSITAASDVSIQLDIQDVQFYADEVDPKPATEASWRDLFGERGSSLIALASSRTNPATEVMQCEMFDRPVFDQTPQPGARELPAHFFWNPAVSHAFPSQFHARHQQLARLDRKAAELVRDEKASVIEFGGAVYVDESRRSRTGATYGVCFAQRRRPGQIWLLLAGITGAATYAAAKVAPRLPTSLGDARPDEVQCFLIRAHLERGRLESLGGLRDSAVEVVAQRSWPEG